MGTVLGSALIASSVCSISSWLRFNKGCTYVHLQVEEEAYRYLQNQNQNLQGAYLPHRYLHMYLIKPQSSKEGWRSHA